MILRITLEGYGFDNVLHTLSADIEAPEGFSPGKIDIAADNEAMPMFSVGVGETPDGFRTLTTVIAFKED